MSIGEILLGLDGAEKVLTAFDRKFSIKQIEIGREERTADGTLVVDIKATKKQFILDYNTIDNDELEYLQALYDSYEKLALYIFWSDTVYNGYWVVMRPFDKTRLLLLSDGIWEGVTIVLDQV